MQSNHIPVKRLRAWTLASLIAPGAMFASGSSWLAVLVVALLCGAVSAAVQLFCQGRPITAQWYAAACWIWSGIFLGSIARYSANCWPDGNAYPVVPLVLLALACVNSHNGGEKASKAGAILIWFVVLSLGIVLGAGVKELNMEWIKPQSGRLNPLLIPLLLIPALTIVLPADKRRCAVSTSVIIAAACVIVAFWVSGSLSEAYAAQVQEPLYEYCKSLSLFGTVERFESFVACALTAGWFSLFGLILSAAGQFAGRKQEKWGRGGVWLCALTAAVIMCLKWDLSGYQLSIGSGLLWVVLPLLASSLQCVQHRRKRRKLE